MSLEGHSTCPHCRAIVQSSICSICGKTSFEEVAAPADNTDEKWWSSLENNELRNLGIGVALVTVVGAAILFVLSRPTPTTVATELPPPAPTTEAPRDLTPQTEAPSIADAPRFGGVVLPGAPREVGQGLSPWETAPPVDFITGLPLDLDLDFTTDIARVEDLLAAIPEAWSLSTLDPPEILTFDGVIDLETVEATQPFLARTIERAEDDLRVGELWLVASGGSPAGDAYLAAARTRWDHSAAVDQFSPGVGIRLWRLGGDDVVNIWATDLEENSMVVILAPVPVAPTVLADAVRDWRRTIAAA